MSESEIELRLPAESRFVAVARVTAASLAAEMDFTMDGIEDLRTGANELVAVLVEIAEDRGAPEIVLHFTLHEDSLEMAGSVPSQDTPSDQSAEPPADNILDDLTERVLAAVVDEYEVTTTSCRIVKRRA